MPARQFRLIAFKRRYTICNCEEADRHHHQRQTIIGMNRSRLIVLLILSVLSGAILSTIVTIAAWNVQIEPRAFQCNDSVWPFNEYWTSMESHESAGDTLSPGWTWERLKNVRILYISAFYLIWTATGSIVFKTVSRKSPEASHETTASSQRTPD